MAEMRTLEDFVRQRLAVEGGGSITLTRTTNGQFQCSAQRGRTNAFSVEVDDDPVTALWNSLVPYVMRRRLPSGREVIVGSDEVEDLLADDVAPAAVDEIEDLLA